MSVRGTTLRNAIVLAFALASIPGVAAAATSRASLTDVENDVICVSCHEPLALAHSPQANAERDYIRSLIVQGQTKAQIERSLVVQYGVAALGRPPAHGFNLTVYILPPALVLAGLTILAFAIPKWRARARVAGQRPVPAGAPLDPADAHRLEDDLARYD